MAQQFSQAGRLASVAVETLRDKLAMERFTVASRLSEPFVMTVDVLAQGPVDFAGALYKPVTISMEAKSNVQRDFHGLLFAVERLDDDQTVVRYQLTVRPWLAALQERSDVRIFQEKTAREVIEAVFADAGFSDYDFTSVQGPLAKREYCVQYRESDFAFVSRLLEDEGLYYYFRHQAGRHVMVICDGAAGHKAPANTPSVDYVSTGDKGRRKVNLWRWSERLTTAVAGVDTGEYAFLTPREKNAGKATPADDGPSNPGAAVYDFPAGVGALAEGGVIKGGKLPAQSKREAEIRLQSLRADHHSFQGEGDCFEVIAGDKMTLARHPQKALNSDYLLVAVTHVFAAESYRSDAAEEHTLEVHLEAIPFKTRYRAPRHTPRPMVGGPQTARVVGPLKEPGPTDDTIHTDMHGRVKVQFYWDRDGKWLSNSSCWVRVSQGWADGGFGAVMLPRIGQEVIVDFLDGDPDRPIITGRVYNADKMPPYALPDHKTVSTIKSRTVGKPGQYPEAEEPPKAGEPGFNELRFEDAGGKEEVFLHAQRDRKTWVRLDHQEKVGRDQGQRVGRDRASAVHRHEALTVETGDETRTVKKGSRKTVINKNDTLNVEKGNSKTTVESGDYSVTVSKGKALIEAKQSIELKVGNTNIKLTPSGIEMNGLTIKIDAKTALSAKGGLTTDLKAGMSFTINGMVVMIN